MIQTINNTLVYVRRSYISDRASSIREQLYNRRYYFLLKRVIDLFVSLVVIFCVLSWLLPIIGLLIKLDSKGPVFFIQKRAGFLGRPFWCIKLRTMVINSYADQLQSSPNDPRITRLGNFLRRSSVDEFPQFFNVLLGDMSIVGPRPHMPKDNEKFGRIVHSYRFRCLVKPGITGMAQVKGFRGPAEDFEPIFHRFQWDSFYIRNASALLDLKIVKETVVQMLETFYIFFWHKNKNLKSRPSISFYSPAITDQ